MSFKSRQFKRTSSMKAKEHRTPMIYSVRELYRLDTIHCQCWSFAENKSSLYLAAEQQESGVTSTWGSGETLTNKII